MGITGNSTNPQIAFSSSPALPQDEIMARLLFGGSVTELSALQVVQREYYHTLAEANRKLSLLSITDALTGIANRRRFDEQIAAG